MKNNYFQNMQQKGIKHRKESHDEIIICSNGIYSKAESEAFKYWALAKHYEATGILIDWLPESELLPDFLATFRRAGIKALVISHNNDSRFEELTLLGCKVLGDCKVFSRSNSDSKVKHIETGVKVLL